MAAQIVAMRRAYPQFTFVKSASDPRYITFVGQVQAHPNLPVYTLKVAYRYRQAPRVQVVSPALVERPPHFYRDVRALCLYHPRNFTWTKETLVADTILPWAIGWVYFYEVWLQTGEWYGAEAAHEPVAGKE
ncbi:hypothetical protein [Hymenobacter saemangeumensis]|uniref:hypothetical protein n=1 Tax=Hymenobacter saemangeumensis TaxID=1084522 RepID=UPI0031E8D98B